jgi:hypothetical protein
MNVSYRRDHSESKMIHPKLRNRGTGLAVRSEWATLRQIPTGGSGSLTILMDGENLEKTLLEFDFRRSP